MTRIAICGRNLDDLKGLLANHPVEIVEDHPDIVVSYGGDGALLGAERTFPGVPKCPIRDSRSNPKCPAHREARILDLLMAGELDSRELIKLEGVKEGCKPLVGLNDVVINKQIMTSCVRYRLWLGDEPYAHHIVGDGVIAATPFGSTAYYRSITRSLFHVGIGLAFNNSTEPLDHLVIREETAVVVEIIRGPAALLADNNPRRVPLHKGDTVTIRPAAGKATILGLNTFRCPECYRRRQDNSHPN